jgi:hypothetical protein
MRLVRRDVVFDIGLTGENWAVFGFDIFPAGKKRPVLAIDSGPTPSASAGVNTAPGLANIKKAAVRRLI